MQRRQINHVKLVLALSFVVMLLPVVSGCDKSGGPLLAGSQQGRERWTICCGRFTEAEVPNPAEYGQGLAEMLGQVKGLRASDINVVTEGRTCTIYYGQYTKKPSGNTAQLVFGEEFRRDIELIRSLSYGGAGRPFFKAQPELIDAGSGSSPAQWSIANAKGTHTLLIGVFYNTPTFNERKQTAEEYVRLLREEGVAAYFYHEQVKSFVFVGDFDESDIVQTPSGPKYGPRVEQFIARREAEFRWFTENGHIRKLRTPEGQDVRPESELIVVPRSLN